MPRRLVSVVVCLAALAVPASASAQGAFSPIGDLFYLGAGSGQVPDRMPALTRPEPPLTATPLAPCGPGSHPQPGVDGRVPAGSAAQGLSCNVEVVGHQGTSGGFKVYRYIDPAGHECAFYDTALLFPVNAFKLDASSAGVAVLDMSDPAHPKQTATLTELPMLSPHESLILNERRGLLAAVNGNPAAYPGLVSIYDVSHDCRHPVLDSTAPVGRLGHESGFAPDGRTFYATGSGEKEVTAIDVTDPKAPHPIWLGNIDVHGLGISPDGNRGYAAADIEGQLAILDLSQIQARKPDPKVSEISRLTWKTVSIPQNALPFTRGGHPYLLEFDEYNAGIRGGDQNQVGAARIIDIADERQPRVIANLRLAVNQPAEHAAASNDPGAFSPVQGYAAHYCDVSSTVDPTVVACSFINSGLRVFDISKLTHPREIAYYVAPTKPVAENGGQASSFAMSKPVIVPERHQVWFTDGATGFWTLRIADAVWPKAAAPCRRTVTVRVRLPRGAKVRRVRARLGGRRVRGAHRVGRSVRLRVRVRRTATLRVRVRLADGRTVKLTRRLKACAGP